MSSTENITLPCDSFLSLTELLVAGHSGQLNVTDEIRLCPNLCVEAWGQGNPDFSGIRMNVCWIIQAALTILMGPRLHFVSTSLPDSVELQTKRRDLYHDFLMAPLILVIPLLVATIVYLERITPLFEPTFLYYLSTTQLFAILIVCLAGVPFHAEGEKKMEWGWICWLITCMLTAFGLYMVIHEKIRMFPLRGHCAYFPSRDQCRFRGSE
ncbi:hypothetical protein B0T16DRAFT_460878 [Cercophora newfieldiana]|uniref:Uncharacterized protein n=1 Tax=Cercophora newfieldiana TaxID=92897 RepID=A0AA39XVS9_9PEZI|nr:hypothetical protein B0T16DRAFT_460878 [Cercophora newfieldiana]